MTELKKSLILYVGSQGRTKIESNRCPFRDLDKSETEFSAHLEDNTHLAEIALSGGRPSRPSDKIEDFDSFILFNRLQVH